MLPRLGRTLSRFFRATAPDPFVLAIVLTAVVFGWAWLATPAGFGDVVDAWQGGFWNLLAFAMQMSLILVTGHALASSPPVSKAIGGLASAPRTPRQAVALTAGVAMTAGLVNWGFGLIVGAILAREAADGLRRRGAAAPRGLLAAAGYTGMLVWHGGLSGSAPLDAASPGALESKLGGDLALDVAQLAAEHANAAGPIQPMTAANAADAVLPLTQTVATSHNLLVTGGVMAIALVILVGMCPKTGRDDQRSRPASTGDPHAPPAATERNRLSEPTAAHTEAEPPRQNADDRQSPAVRFLERNGAVVWLIVGPALGWLALRFVEQGFDALNLNTVNLLFLTVGLALHGSARSYGAAVEDAVKGCAGIIIQFPLYAGIMGVMTATGLAAMVSGWFVSLAGESESLLRVLTFLSAGLVNLFVPSGGGQWAVQGPIAMDAVTQLGGDPARTLMAIAYGDQLTNMLQPFWALPLLAITRAKAGEVVGYTAVVMIAAGLWIALMLALG